MKQAQTMGVAATLSISCHTYAQWVEFEEDPSRLSGAHELLAGDPDEKDYAWGDLDQDGDVDLVVVRKEPFTTTGRRPNLLLLNENGVLTDRTAEFASASDVEGDQGFLTPTNDRDVEVVDLNGDGWPDVVTAPTLTDNESKHLSHPRVYINLGEADGLWLGLRYEDARIPQMHPFAGPRFCAVSAGDVTGDGALDLYFSDYDSGGNQLFDFNDRLLVNDGNGFFTDETTLRLTAEMYTSEFGIANEIADMNSDGVADIIKLTSLNIPYHIGIMYNDPDNIGFFDDYDGIYELSPYHMAVGELNNDGLLDVIAVDDSTDRYLIHTGVNAANRAEFSQQVFGPASSIIEGGNVVIDDLDGDGWNDVIVCDVDVDIPGCNHRTFVYHNLGNAPNVSLVEQDNVIPDNALMGVYDAAVFDIDGDGRLDIVLGRCAGTQVWMNVAPSGVLFQYPGGLPEFVTPGEPTVVDVHLQAIGASPFIPESARVWVSTNGKPFIEGDISEIGKSHFEIMLPPVACASHLSFYMTVENQSGEVFADPPTAPESTYLVIGAGGTETVLSEAFEDNTNDWAVINDATVLAGAWERADPIGTLVGTEIAAPDDDATPGDGNVMAFVTGNGVPGGNAASSDLDGGPTMLVSPPIDLAGSDAEVSYARWFYSTSASTPNPDSLVVEVSGDGQEWVEVETVQSTDGIWASHAFIVGAFIEPTGAVQVRFSAADAPNNSITEAGIDDFHVEQFTCSPPCAADLAGGKGQLGDGVVNTLDLLVLLGQWGGPGAADIAGPGGEPDGVVDALDLLALLGVWGPCEA